MRLKIPNPEPAEEKLPWLPVQMQTSHSSLCPIYVRTYRRTFKMLPNHSNPTDALGSNGMMSRVWIWGLQTVPFFYQQKCFLNATQMLFPSTTATASRSPSPSSPLSDNCLPSNHTSSLITIVVYLEERCFPILDYFDSTDSVVCLHLYIFFLYMMLMQHNF